MSYTDDFFKELNKKNKKNKKEENDTTKNKTKSNSGYANEFYSALNDDIAPLPSTATRYSELAPTKLASGGGEKDSWFKTGGFSDGIDGVGDFFGDLGETVAGTVGDLGLGMVKGVGRTVEGIVDLGTYAVGGVGGLLGFDDFKEKAKKVAQYNATDEWTKPATDFIDQYSVLGNKADMVSEGLGQVAAILLTAGVGAAAGLGSAGVTALTTGVTGLSSMGTGIGEAYNENATDSEAFLYGLGAGAIEAGTELLSGGLGKAVKALGISRGIGGLDDIFAKKLSSTIVKSISNESVQKVLGNTIEAGVKAGGEGVEEVLSGLGSAVMKWLTYEKDEDIKKLIEDEDLLEQFVVGAITSSIAQGADYVKANKSGRDFVTGYTNNEQAVIDKEVEKRVSEKEKNGKKLSNKEIGEIEDQVRDDMEHGQIDIETIEEVLGGDKYTSYKNTVKNEDELKAEYEQLSNIRKSDLTTKQEKRLAELEAMNLDDTTKRNSLRKELNDTVFPQLNNSKLAESYKEIERQDQKFEVDLTKYKGKQREAVERAVKSGVLNNTYRAHVLVDTLSRIEADKGIAFDYTNNKKLKESGFAVEGVRVNGYANKSTGTVTLNVQSQKAWQSVVGHEITHILKDTGHYKALKDALFAYAESKGELANRRTELTELYQNMDADVDEELTADLVGDYLFTDKAFIDRLTGNRTLFEKIYDEIKYLCKVATGKELTEIEKVKREFDMAWKEVSAKGVNGTDGKNQYSLTAVDAVQPKSDKWARTHTTAEAMARFPNMWNVSAEESEVRNPTQITSTVNTYRKIYNFLQNEGFDGKILDASSGLGYGTKAGIEEYGFDVEDIEPYPDANYTPKYQDYSTLDEKYDVIISNAVLNVLPQDQRDALVVKMGELLNDGGRLFVNVRGKDVETLAKTDKNIHLGNMEWIETVKGSYQKGFTKPELVAYLQDALGDGFTVKPTNIFGGVAAVVTKDSEKVQYSVSAETDADYMSAVERGDTETAQRMVDEAAKKAGYNSPVLYHGSPSFGFTQIYTKKSNDHISFFATDSMQTAGTYSGTSTVRNIGDTSESSLGMYQFYANTDGMVEFDAKGAESNHIALGQAEKDYNDFVYGSSWYSFATAKQLAKYAKQKGYTGVIIKNVVDAANPQSRKTLSPANVYIFFSPQSQLKSADPVTYDDNGNVIPLSQRFNDKNDDIRFSLSSMANTFYGDENMSSVAFEERDYKQTVGYKNYVNQCVNNMRQTRSNFDETVARKEIEDQIDGIVRVAIAAKKAGYDIHDDAVKREKTDSKKRLLFSSLEPNSDYFTSSDISTICDKRQNFAEIYDDIVRAEEAKGVPRGKRFFDNVDNYFYLHKILADKGLTQPCRQCYVESMRKNLAPMANAFLRLVNETDANNKANDQLYQQSGKNKGELKSSNAELREKVLEVFEEHPEYEMSASDLTVEMLTTENGLAQLKIQAPLIYEAFNSFYGQSKPKMPKSATPFRFGELTALLTDDNGKIKQSLVNRINSTGGFRLQSYSDFQIQNYTDVLQVIFEAGTLGLNGHAYTKVPAFLEATDGTNLKRNISIFMYKDGNEWKIDRNDSFPYELDEIYDIVNSDESGNTSIIAVSQNKEMSAWIMANDNVGMGIHFHKRGMKMGTVRDTDVKTADGRIVKGYSGTIDHTKQQTEVWAKASADHKALTKVKKGIDIYSFWDFDNKANLSKNELIEKNLKAYIDACDEAGYLPKFRDYVMNNGSVLNDVLRFSKELGFVPYNATIEDISFEYKGYRIPYGYYKFLVDFGMFKPDGSASPHETLSLKNYDFDKAVEFFGDSEKLRRNEILQQFANGEERRKYRDSNLSAEELAEIVNQKRKEVVDSIVAPTQMSLSKEGEQYAPVGDYSTPFNELAYNEDIAPVEAVTSTKEAVKPTANTDEGYPDNFAPMTEEEANSLAKDYLNSLTEEDAPPEMPEPYYGEEDAPVDLFEDRDIIAVGRRSVKAYMYENPEVKPFFQAEANIMLGDLARTTRGERVVDAQVLYDTNGENGVYGLKRNTSPEFAYLKDEFGYTYDEIKAGLKAIIEDDGAENNACSKRIEFMLNDRLMNGYRDFVDGIEIPANQEYIRLVREKGINEYNEEARKHFFENADSYAPPAEEDIAPVMGEKTAPAADEIQPMTEDEANAIQEEKAKADKAAEGTPKSRRQLHRSIIEGIKSAFKSAGFDFDEALKNAKNLSTFATVDNTPQRVMEKALGYKEGQTLADLTVNKVAQNETAGIKWLNSYTDRKNGLLRQISDQYRIKPGSKESAAAQMYAEGFYVNDNNEIVAYGDAELAQDFPDVGVQYRIKGLAHDPRIRQIYDETLDAINASRTRNAYPEIQKLDNYFLHFRAMDDTFSRLGLPFNPNDIRAKDLPTDLNGVTADLKPGQPYFASAMHRIGKRTSFDLLGGLERYLTSAKNQIYHIDDIQTLRALRNYIADTYGQANGLEGIDALSEEETQDRIKAVYNSHLSTFAKFLNEEANILAGKTALIDRGLEGVIGRRGMTFLDTVQKQTGSNMVGFNISSSLTNFLPIAQTFAKTNKFDFVKAFAQTVSNKIGSVFGKNDGFAENSPVMIRRKGADRFYRTPYQRVSDTGYVLMSAIDDISTELIARTKFNELTRKGMDEQTAHFETDKWVSRLMGDRSLGQQPQLYNSKTLGFLTQFQLEVRNQLDSQFYDTIQEAKVSNEDIENALVRNAKTAAKVTSTFVQLAVVQHLFGKAFESVAGYNPAFDIISVLATMFGFDDEEDSEDTALDNIEQGFFDLLEDLPYTSTFTGGRIPIASALPIKELIKGEDSYGNEKSRLETLKETAPYYVLPGGYGQLKKTYQGLNMFSDEHPVSGSYTDSGKLRFPVEDTTANRVQAAIFGQYASENAREYFDNDYAPMDPGKYAVAKSVGGYSAYKTYSDELYDIHADKDENGKSINGSRKEKVFDYINNLDADYYTKIILWKSEYPADDTYNAEIVDYVVNGDFTYDEKVSILTELGFRVTEDGEIYDD